MNEVNFLQVLSGNVKCLFCKKKNCPVKYYPQRKKTQIYEGRQYITRCEKDRQKALDKALKRKLP